MRASRTSGRTYAVLERMAKCGMPLLVHGESRAPGRRCVRPRIGLHRRDARSRSSSAFRASRWCSSTSPRRARSSSSRPRAHGVAATITPQHLLHNRNAIFSGGIRPHYYCLPILKRERDRLALVGAATGGNPRFFLGTDSAPHERAAKETACGCAGMFTAHAAIELYAEVFEASGPPRPPGSLCEPLRRRLLRAAPPRGAHHAGARALDGARRITRSAAGRVVPYRAGEHDRLAPRADGRA